jgi:hypothetical protein
VAFLSPFEKELTDIEGPGWANPVKISYLERALSTRVKEALVVYLDTLVKYGIRKDLTNH